MLLNNQWITDDIEEGRKKSQETNENESTMTQSLRHAAKTFLRGKFIAIQCYSRNKNNLKQTV